MHIFGRFRRFSGSFGTLWVTLETFLHFGNHLLLLGCALKSPNRPLKPNFLFQIDCDGLFIAFSFKLLILLFGSWALFFRPTKATMPRIYLFRACICTLLFIFIFAFWLFYGVRVFDEQRRRIQYEDLVSYANSMVDTMLFIHYLAIILMEIKHQSPQ